MAQREMAMSVYLSQDTTKQYLQSILGERTGQFVTSLTSLAGSSATLQKCTRNSLLGCAIKAAAMDLSIDPSLGLAWAIPYGDVATFQLGSRAFTQLALRTGQYQTIGAREVREGEFKGRDFVGDPHIEWLPDDERLDKKVVGYMAGLKLVNGFQKTSYWTVKEVEKHADKYSQGYRSFKTKGASQSTARSGNMSSPWASEFDKMAEKTVLKSLISKYGIMSTEMQSAVKYDQAAITIDTATGEETVDYLDNDESFKPTPLTTGEQEAILKKYGAGKVTKALETVELGSLNEVTDESVQSFTEVLNGLK